MDRCGEVRELLGLGIDGELDEAQAETLRDHLAACPECAELAETMAEIVAAGGLLGDLEAPDGLAAELAATPCRLWLGLLFQAVDREITPHNLERLLAHLESCPSCRQTWQDLTLIHQTSEAMQPPRHLVKRCIEARERRPRQAPVLSRRVAVAAAYILAVLTSLIVGNPVTLARSQAAPAVERVAEMVGSEVSEVAAQGRGELRVMVWRIWQWGENRIDDVRALLGAGHEDDESTPAAEAADAQGEST